LAVRMIFSAGLTWPIGIVGLFLQRNLQHIRHLLAPARECSRKHHIFSITTLRFRIKIGIVAHINEPGKLTNIMSLIAEFVVYDILFWSFIGILVIIIKRDHFAHRPGARR
jgi:hypothetical protein